MSQLKWLEERRKGIGGSDVAAICGLSPWRTAFEVYQEKVGEAPASSEPNDAMKYGLMMEGVLRQWYSDETGLIVRLPKSIIVHPVHEFMLANLDGLTEDRVVEIKTARSSKDWGEPGTDEIPVYYRTQVEHYLIVTGFELADVVVSFAGSMPVVYTVEADGELQEMLIEQELEFWRMVQERIPPDPVSYSDMVARFRKSNGVAITADEFLVRQVKELIEVREDVKHLEKTEEQLKASIMGALGDAEILLDPGGLTLVTWKTSKPSKRFDSKALQNDHPDLYTQYLKESEGSRRFLVKG